MMIKNKIAKTFLSCILVLGLLLTAMPLTFAGDDVKVTLNGEYIDFDQPPVIIDGRTLVPIRAVFEALGADVYWMDELEVIAIIKNDIKLILRNGFEEFYKFTGSDFELFKEQILQYEFIDVEEYEFDVPPQIIGNRTLVPIRLLCEAMDIVVSWDNDGNIVSLVCEDDFILDINTDKTFSDQVFAFLQDLEDGNIDSYGEYDNYDWDGENYWRSAQSSFRIYHNTGGYPIAFGEYQPIMDEAGNALISVTSIKNVYKGGISYTIDGEKVIIHQKGFEYSTTVEITVGSNALYKNGDVIEMDTVPVIHNGQIYIPMQAVGEAMEHYVYKNERLDQLSINYTAAEIYIWNENEDSSESGLRYAIFQGRNRERNLSEIYGRAVSDFAEIRTLFERVPDGDISLATMYKMKGYKVPYSVIDRVEHELISRFGYVVGLWERAIDEAPFVIQGLGDFTDKWYSEQLTALGESSIRESMGQIYRFTYIPAFFKPFSIRIDVNPDGTGILTYSICKSPFSPNGGEIEKTETHSLSKEQINSLLQGIDKSDFWNLPTEIDDMGLDGCQYIIEGVKDGKYHIVDRWTPSEGEVYDLGNLFISLSGKNN